MSWLADDFSLPTTAAGLRSMAQEIADVTKIHKIDLQAKGFPAALPGPGLIMRVSHIDHWEKMMDEEPGRILNRMGLQISEVNS